MSHFCYAINLQQLMDGIMSLCKFMDIKLSNGWPSSPSEIQSGLIKDNKLLRLGRKGNSH